MLKGISPLLSPELLSVLHRMGHGDELVLADAHFPGESCNGRVLRADGHPVDALLRAILPLFELDTYVEAPLIMMAPVAGDELDPAVEQRYREAFDKPPEKKPLIARVDRFPFYERSRSAFAIVMTGETAKYGNLLLVKGVTPSG